MGVDGDVSHRHLTGRASHDLVDDLAASTDDFSDLVNRDLHGDDPGRPLVEFCTRCGNTGKNDIVDDLKSSLVCHLESSLDDV